MTTNEARELFNYPSVENGDVRFIRGEYQDADTKVEEITGDENEEE